MELPASDVIEVLKEKEVDFLYHANTVKTSCTFTRAGALLSRGTVERMQSAQTPQYSDDLDKKYGIWYDIFLDTTDIHIQANQENHYGPILFVFDLNILTSHHAPPLWITKKNPTNWKKGEAPSERWFQSIDELRGSFEKNAFGHMLVLRHIGGVLQFKDHLEKIIIDKFPDGVFPTKIDVPSFARGALAGTIAPTKIVPKFETRECASSCQCQKHYKAATQERMLDLFRPR